MRFVPGHYFSLRRYGLVKVRRDAQNKKVRSHPKRVAASKLDGIGIGLRPASKLFKISPRSPIGGLRSIADWQYGI